MSKKPYIHKRLIAYAIDILIVAVISSIISLPFAKTEEYEAKSKELYQVLVDYNNNNIDDEEYLELSNNLNYEMTKINVSQTIVISIVSLIYFVGFNYYNQGQSLGKRVMKLRIVSSDESKLTINNYFIRTLVGNTTLANIVTVILILTLSKESYLIYEDKFSAVFCFIYILCFGFAMYRNDGKGLHDLLASTIVINSKENVSSEVKEAIIVEEKNNGNKIKKNKEVK